MRFSPFDWNKDELPQEEFESRIFRVKDNMRKRGFDALLAYSTPPPPSSGNLRYISNFAPSLVALCAVLPLNDEPILVSGTPGAYIKLAERLSSIKKVIPLQDVGNDCKNILKKNGITAGKLGIVGFKSLPSSYYVSLLKSLPNMDLIDADNIFAEERMVKSELELSLLRKALNISNEGFKTVSQNIKSGKTDKEVFASLYRNIMPKCEDIMFNICSASQSKVSLRPPIGNSLRKDESVLVKLYSSYNGYWAGMGRTIATGKSSNIQEKILDVAIKSQKAAIKQIKPGVRIAKVAKAASKIIFDAGLSEQLKYVFGHGFGLDQIEPPIITDQENIVIKTNNVFSIRVCIKNPNKGGALIEDPIVVTKSGSAPLDKTI